MSQELDRRCPECAADRTFYLAASTHLHLGEKRKWVCPECDYGIVRIDGEIDSAIEA